MTLEELRSVIDSLDNQILGLLNERARLAQEIAAIKREKKVNFYVPERERAVYEKLRAENKGPLPDRSVKAIYREIISASRALENPIRVAFLGPRDTFSHMAALRIFGSNAEYHPMATVDDVFTEVERHRVDYGLVPVETSMGGGVSDTLDRFLLSDLKIVNEVMMRVTQHLLSNRLLEEITRVYSKAQSFVQCRNWLKANLPNAALIETSSTAEAARLVAEQHTEHGAAAIASELAAQTYDLRILCRGIEDAAHNSTRFFVIGKHMARPTGNDKTAILCSVKDRPGALYAMLTPLAEAEVNLTRIESRPSQKKPWEYVFFIDMLGHAEEPRIKAALEVVATYCNEYKVLGSFPHGELEE